MNTTLTFIDLAGSIALLLWGVHMVQSGITRALGANLRRVLTSALGNRAKAFFAGIGITALLQSSTATGLMAASFAAGGAIDLVPALAVMLGANVGTTIIVQALSFDVSRVAPLFILVGVVLFRRGGAARNRDLGRVGIGLGLMLLALSDLLTLVTPYEDVPSLRLLMGSIATDPTVAVIIAAMLTWAAHSSVAVVILITSLAARGVVPPDAAFALVLGANLGTAINPVLEGNAGADPAGRRLPIGNLLNRILGCAAVLFLLGPIGRLFVAIEPHQAGRAVADFHTAFNLVLALFFLPLLRPYARLLQRLLPARAQASDPGHPLYLDRSALEAPSVALANAARESLRMVDLLEAMLRSALDDMEAKDRDRVVNTRRMDDAIDRLNRSIREYVAAIDADVLDEAGHRRLTEILIFATNLEHAGDVVERSLTRLAAKRIKRGVDLGQDMLGSMRELADRLQSNLQLAAAAFMSENRSIARQLLDNKPVFRDIEAKATALYMESLRNGSADNAASLQLDVLRDLRRINSHLGAAVRPILEGFTLSEHDIGQGGGC
jgi:phosphate:Na+ symporter